MKQFQGRVICPGTCEAEALVSHGGFNTLASYQMALMFHDKQVKCGDQNNPDLYKKPMIGKALCLPETIGSTTGGMVLYTACASGQQPACMLFSNRLAGGLGRDPRVRVDGRRYAGHRLPGRRISRRRADGADCARARRRHRRGGITLLQN